MRRLWPRTRGAWVAVTLTVGTFFLLDVLALTGSDLAVKLLISLVGWLAGMMVAFAVAYPLRERFGGSLGWRMAGIALGLASMFGILVVGSTLAGIPTFPTAEGGNVGSLIYGLALGFGVYFGRVLSLSGTFLARTEHPDRGPELRAVAVMVGAVAALFTVSFAAYVLLEYVVGPLVRYFA